MPTDERTAARIAWRMKSGACNIENRVEYPDLAQHMERLYRNRRVESAEAWEITDRNTIVGAVWINDGKRTWWSE